MLPEPPIRLWKCDRLEDDCLRELGFPEDRFHAIKSRSICLNPNLRLSFLNGSLSQFPHLSYFFFYAFMAEKLDPLWYFPVHFLDFISHPIQMIPEYQVSYLSIPASLTLSKYASPHTRNGLLAWLILISSMMTGKKHWNINQEIEAHHFTHCATLDKSLNLS